MNVTAEFKRHSGQNRKTAHTTRAWRSKSMQAMQRETPNIGEISEIISADAPLSAKVLRVVNSPFYGLSNKITSVHQAMVYLGLNTVKNLALSFSLLRGFAPKKKGAFDYVQFSKDSLIGAVAAKLLTEKINRQHGENAFFLGLLQNIGMLIMAESMPDEYEKVIGEAASSGSPLHEIENNLLGINHMEVGEFVTDSWGLPATFNVPIGFHHCPERLASPLDDIEQLTKILHLSSLYIDLFKSSDLNAGYAEIEKYIQAYEFNSVIDKSDIAEQIAEGVKSIFPIFDLQIDEKKTYRNNRCGQNRIGRSVERAAESGPQPGPLPGPAQAAGWPRRHDSAIQS